MFRQKFSPKKLVSVFHTIPQQKKFRIFTIGATASTFGTLSGAGSGILLVPLLNSFTSLTRHECTAASLFGITVSGIASVASFLYLGVDISERMMLSSGFIGVFASFTSYYGARYGKTLDARKLTLIFAWLACFIGLFVPLYGYYKKHHSRIDIPNQYLFFAAAGAFFGFLSGLLGLGGAVFYVPLLTTVTSLSHVEIIATAILSTLLPSALGTYSHYKLGNLNLKRSIILSIGTSAGGFLGAKIATYSKENFDEDYLKIAFGTIIFLTGLRQFKLAAALIKK